MQAPPPSGGKTIQDPTPEELKALAAELVRTEHILTLATASKSEAWAAPVYYINLNFSFYFFSDPTARHIQESVASGQAAAAIYARASSWQEIRGIQMSGRIKPVSPGLQALQAIRAYLRKFPFTLEFFAPGQAITLEAFAVRFNVKLYILKPKILYYLDNKIRFGFREQVPI